MEDKDNRHILPQPIIPLGLKVGIERRFYEVIEAIATAQQQNWRTAVEPDMQESEVEQLLLEEQAANEYGEAAIAALDTQDYELALTQLAYAYLKQRNYSHLQQNWGITMVLLSSWMRYHFLPIPDWLLELCDECSFNPHSAPSTVTWQN
ncbi:MAG TPA: hypothetical protein V6D30_19495 [Leptolyngbyaceae cyanobacterium]